MAEREMMPASRYQRPLDWKRMRRTGAPRPGGPFDIATVLWLQRTGGNAAVSNLIARRLILQRQSPAHVTPAPPGPPAPGPGKVNPLDETRIAWIQDLPATIRNSIDSVGDKLATRIVAIDKALAKAQDVLVKGMTTPESAKATIDVRNLTDQKTALDKTYGSDWAKKRLALMDYFNCSLGSDAGTERYFKSLVQFGPEELYVHPEVARRLRRVREGLAKLAIPMPQTDVGFALRGHHVHPQKENMHPGMMTHALGVAVDWYAYKNVHFKDPDLMELVDAVTGHPHHIELSWGDMPTIVAMGEKSMGNTLTGQQANAATRDAALIQKIGDEFDRLAADSDMFRNSLTFDPDEFLKLHHELIDLMAAVGEKQTTVDKQKVVVKQNAARKSPAAKTALDNLSQVSDKLSQAQEALNTRITELRPTLETLFKPWLDKLHQKKAELQQRAAQLGVSDLSKEVSTDVGLRSIANEVAVGVKPAASALDKVIADAQAADAQVTGIRQKIGNAQAYLVSKGTEAEKQMWSDQLDELNKKASAALLRDTAVVAEAQVLKGGQIKPNSGGLSPTAKKPNWDKDVAAWDAELTVAVGKIDAAETALGTAKSSLSSETIEKAYQLRDKRESNEKIKQRVKPKQFEQLQAMKYQLWHVEHVATRLLEDPSFMFKGKTAVDPGVAQLVGVLGSDKKDRRDLGGGGYFGTPTSGIEAKRKGKPTAASGFGKEFFQAMVRYGFEPAAWWDTADSMHFQIRGLVDQIVPVEACKEPSQGKSGDEKTQAAAAAAHVKAVGARAAGEAFSQGAAKAHEAWVTEASPP